VNTTIRFPPPGCDWCFQANKCQYDGTGSWATSNHF